MTLKQFKDVLQTLHQPRDHSRRLRTCRRPKRKSCEDKKMMELYAQLPLLQHCWYLNFVGCTRLGEEAMLHAHLIPTTVINLDILNAI